MSELQSGRIFAALDVYYQEPVPKDHPLLTLDNVICVPHIGGFARNYKRFMGEFVVENLHNFSQGNRRTQGTISLEEFGRMTTMQLQ
ncbi:Glyoxylate/hydroxypyruvate reductase B [compost metagenome]